MSNTLIRPLAEDYLPSVWTDVLERRLRDELAQASVGHCLRVTSLPRNVLESVAQRLCEDWVPGSEIFLVDRGPGPEPWRVAVHKVIERRNAEEGVVLALFPPDVQLAAGDSVDISTFRDIPVDGLLHAVEQELKQRVPAGLSPFAANVLRYLETKRLCDVADRLAYLALLACQETTDPAVAGGALFVVGLIPDFDLFVRPEELPHRLGQINLKVVDELRDETTTTLERVLRLRLEPGQELFRSRLLALFRDYRPSDIRGWGERIATSLEWRNLSLERWPLEGAAPPADLRIDVEPLKLARREDGLLLLNPSDRLRVAWSTNPPPLDVPLLGSFRIEIVDSEGLVAWESPLYKAKAAKGSSRSRNLTQVRNFPSLEPGVYFVRVVGINDAGDPFPPPPLRDPEGGAEGTRTNETENFLFAGDIGDEVDNGTPAETTTVADYAEAEYRARVSAVQREKDPSAVLPQVVEWTSSIESRGEAAYATIRFDVQRSYTVRLSQRLRILERSILEHPDDGGRRELSTLDSSAGPDVIPLGLPQEFADARRVLFAAINDAKVNGGAVVALTDLCALADGIEAYAQAYLSWLQTGDQQALWIDVTRVRLPDYGYAALMSPTHPLRLLWLLQQQQLARNWLESARVRGETPSRALGIWQRAFAPWHVPSLVILNPEEPYLDSGPLVGGWSAFLPPQAQDSRAIQAVLRARFGIPAALKTEADALPSALTDKFEGFLRQHPYTTALTINVVNPGDAQLIVDALIRLEKRWSSSLPSVRYVIRLFTESPHREGVGDALRELSDPERQISEEADRLMSPGRSLLFPKLSWARNRLTELRLHPEQFPAHLTILLDTFPVTARVKPYDPTERSSFVHGLVQDVPRRFIGQGQSYTWVHSPSPSGSVELPDAPGRSALIADLLTSTGTLQAQALAPSADTTGQTSVVMLNLDTDGRSLIQSAHTSSTWVLTVDEHLGLDYFDGARGSDRPGYLLDFTPEFMPSGGRQLLLTTKVDDEVAQLIAPAAIHLGLDSSGPGAYMLLEALRSLSGRLAMRLLSSPSQVQGAIGMALARLFLEAYGLLESSLIIPLDAHPELSVQEENPLAARLRGDLLVVSADQERRHLDMLLIEAKNHSGEGALSSDLRQRIGDQVRSSESALREQFDPFRTDPDRIDRHLQSWRLSQVLSFYLDRAVRYRLAKAEAADSLRRFFLDLESGYSLSVRKMGLVFLQDAATTSCDNQDPDVPIWVVGNDHIERIVGEALHRYSNEGVAQQAAADEISVVSQPTMHDDETWETVRRSFGGPALVSASNGQEAGDNYHAATVVPPAPDPSTLGKGSDAEDLADAPPASVVAPVATRTQTNGDAAGEVEIDAAVLLGESRMTPQFGILGEVAAEPWKRVAIDLNGCNTISIFGVQGSGKSYTVGSVLEMATKAITGLNQLPHPLGAVVFHYHQTQDYPPEFVSMVDPNDDPDQVAALKKWGVSPAGLDDLLILTTADTIAARREEFPGVAVEPIAFSSAELTVADWRFLMGATGSDALYLKLVNEVMRKRRSALTLDAIMHGLREAPLSDIQRTMAETRLEFASRFIDDTRSLRSLMLPGRLIVVDLRDEFIEKEQALGLFVTMLNIFSAAGMGGSGNDRFNKLIVFDEAHKYMGGAVIAHVVEAIREMRHKGVSIVIASQDPINVPPAVIELSSVVALHRFNSPNWLRHIQKSLSALGELTSPMLASLGPGEAFVWANKATDQIFTRRAVKLRMRPRASKHGGSTRTAT